MENEVDLGGRRKIRRLDSVGSVDVDPDDLENRKEAGRKAQGAQGLSKTVDGVCPFAASDQRFS